MPIFRPRTLVASAGPLLGGGIGDPGVLGKSASAPPGIGLADPRQVRAWDIYDRVGPVGYAMRYSANVMRRVRYFAAVIDPDNPDGDPIPGDRAAQKQPDGRPPLVSQQEYLDAQDCIARIVDDRAGQGEIIYQQSLNLLVAGDYYVIAEPRPDGTERWAVYSVVAISKRRSGGMSTPGRAAGWWVPDESGRGTRELADGTLIVRNYQPHPRDPRLGDSALMHVLDDCDEYDYLSRASRGAARNRLAGNGIFLIPSEIDIPPDPANADEMAVGRGSVTSLLRMIGRAMAAAIKDERSPSSHTPFILQGPGEKLQYAQHLTFDRPMDKTLAAQRDNRLKVIAVGLDLPQERLSIEGLSDNNHWCSPSVTEIFSRERGWINQESLSVGDIVMTLNHETGLSEWQPVKDIYRAQVTDEPMLSMSSRSHRSLSTMGHRWPIVKMGRKVGGNRRRWTTSGEGFASTDRVPLAAPLDRDGLPIAPKWSDDFVRLVAAYSADGTILLNETGKPDGGKYIRIAKFQDREIRDLRQILAGVYGPGRCKEYRHPTASRDGTAFLLRKAECAPLFEVTDERRAISREFVRSLTAGQLQLLLESCILIGDGVRRSTGYELFQVEPSRLDAYEYAAILLGYKVSRGVRNQQTGFGTRPLTWLRISTASDVMSPWSCERTVETYTGLIWCPTTANGTWLARHEGTVFFTGNSGAQVAENEWNGHLAPLDLILRGNWASTLLRPMMAVLGYGPDVLERWTVGSDPTAAIEKPDKSANAQQGHDRFVISDAALRKYSGFDEDDAPTPEELADQIERVRLSKTRSMSGPEQIPSGDVSPAGTGGSPAPPPEPVGGPSGDPGQTAPVRASAARTSDRLRWLADMRRDDPGRLAQLEAAGRHSAITSAANTRRRALGTQLADLDERLLNHVLVGADAALRRELDRAGSRIQQAAANRGLVAGGRRAAKASLSAIPKRQIAAHLGRAAVEALIASGATEPFDDTAFDEFCDQVDGQVADTNDRAKDLIIASAAALAARHDQLSPITSSVLAEWQSTQARNAELGRTTLKAALLDLAGRRLFDPDPRVDDRGEYDPDLSVPASTVRPALAAYGGSSGSGDGSGGQIPSGVLLVAAGATMLGLARTGGLAFVGYEWRHGNPLHPFEPHENLDGMTFDNFDDASLSVGDSYAWIESLTGGYYPGDHEGCTCLVGVIFGEGDDI